MQGIPFAIKDTFDLKGVATAYGSWQYLNNVIDDFESPLATNAIKAGAVPVFKSSVPQLTWGTANFNGTVYSCLHGGYSAGPGNSGGSSIGSGNAVCLGVVPVAICEQTGSSCARRPRSATASLRSSPRSARSRARAPASTRSRPIGPAYSVVTSCRARSCTTTCAASRQASRDVPFEDPSKVDISTLSIGFTDNHNTTAWPWAFDTPFGGKRNNVLEALQDTGATVSVKSTLGEHLGPMNQLVQDLPLSRSLSLRSRSRL